MTDQDVVVSYSASLSRLGIRHLVGGSLASAAWGEQRFTNDADFLVEIGSNDIERFIDGLPDGFCCEPMDIAGAVASTEPFPSFQTMYEPTAFKIDYFVAKEEWHQYQLERAILLNLSPEGQVPFASPEDIFIAKCLWFDLGRRVSDRQWHDLVRLFEVQEDNLDRAYIEKWLRHFDVLDVWEEVRRQAKTSEPDA